MADKSAKGSKAGRSKLKMQRRKIGQHTQKNKLKRILRSNGLPAAQAYASAHLLTSYLLALTRKHENQRTAT